MNSKEMHEELVRRVRAAGESLIKNAESIVGTEENLVRLSISMHISDMDEYPEISINRGFVPERSVEEVNGR